MTKHIDQKFAKIVALMNSTEHKGERDAARKRAEAVASSCGMTFDEALKASAAKPEPAPFVDIMAGFDDWMEERVPGYKQRRAFEKAHKAHDRRLRMDALLDRYGSKEAILAPCEKELLLREALKPWIEYCKPPLERWTHSVDGSGAVYIFDVSQRVRAAVAAAYPLPTTLADAMAEFEYWQVREVEMEDALDDQFGDTALDRPANYRKELMQDLIETELRLTTLKDVVDRFAFYRERAHGAYRNENTEDAIFRDLEAMVQAEADRSNLSTISQPSTCPPNGQIADMLQSNPAWSDRRIARECGCSPTTAGKVRARLGLAQSVRSVQRRGQIYEMKVH